MFRCRLAIKASVSDARVVLQHFIGQREEFETVRDGVLVWLTEMDLQLTNIEHFSECDVQAKLKQLRVRTVCVCVYVYIYVYVYVYYSPDIIPPPQKKQKQQLDLF